MEVRSRSVQGSELRRSPAAAQALRELHSLASTLAVRWDEMADPARAQILSRLARVGAELERLADVQRTGATDVESIPHDALGRLTPRELEVLEALASGASTQEIAETLRIGQATVRSHVKRILGKLGAHSRLEAVAMLRDRRLVIPRLF